MADPQKPLNQLKPPNRLKPFLRINNDTFIPANAPDGLGVACGCHTPDDIPDMEDAFKKFLADPNNTGLLGNLLTILNDAHKIARDIATVAQTINQIATAAALLLGSAAGTPIAGLLAALLTAAKATQTIADFIDNVVKAFDDTLKEFLSRIGADLARRAVRRIPQWVPVNKGASSTQITPDQIMEVEGTVTRSYGDPIETPFFQWHHWLNWSFQVQPEDNYKNLLVPNFTLNTDGEKAGETSIIQPETFEVQWDAGALLAGDDGNGPYEAGFDDVRMPDNDGPMTGGDTRESDWIWPMTGMHAWASGRWVYDCARTDKLSGSDPKMMTMINPPRAVATALWEARQFSENLPGKSSGSEPTNRVPAIRFMFLASRHGGYMSYDSLGQNDYEFILDLPPIDAPLTPFPIGHTFAHKRDPGEPPDFPHNTIVIRPRLLRELVPLGGPVTDLITPVIQILPPPPDKPGAAPQQVKITVRAADIAKAKGGSAGFILSLGWLDPNLTQASTVKNCNAAFSALQGRLAVDRDSPLNQLQPLFANDLKQAKDKLHRTVDDFGIIPNPLPGQKNVSINDLINNNLPKPFPHDQIVDVGKKIQDLVHKAIDAAFDKIVDELSKLISGTQTEEWLLRVGINGRWQTRFLKDVDKSIQVLPNPPTFQVPLGPDDFLFYSSGGVEFNPVGDMMREARNQRLLTHKVAGVNVPFTWPEIVSATGKDLTDLVFQYALAILLGNSKTGILALGIENTVLGIRDPKKFDQTANDPEVDNPIAMKGVQTGSTPVQPVTKFARAAGEHFPGDPPDETKGFPQEYILVENQTLSDYKLTALIQVADQKPQ